MTPTTTTIRVQLVDIDPPLYHLVRRTTYHRGEDHDIRLHGPKMAAQVEYWHLVGHPMPAKLFLWHDRAKEWRFFVGLNAAEVREIAEDCTDDLPTACTALLAQLATDLLCDVYGPGLDSRPYPQKVGFHQWTIPPSYAPCVTPPTPPPTLADAVSPSSHKAPADIAASTYAHKTIAT